MTRTNNWRSIEFPDRWLPSNHSAYGVCERKHAISNTPKEKNHTLKDRESEGATARLRNGKWGARETCSEHVPNMFRTCSEHVPNMFRTMVIDSFAVCAVAPSCWNHTLAQSPPTEYYPFKRCQIPVGHPLLLHWPRGAEIHHDRAKSPHASPHKDKSPDLPSKNYDCCNLRIKCETVHVVLFVLLLSLSLSLLLHHYRNH